MLNEIKYSDYSPNNIVYINGVPYLVGTSITDLERLGNKGEVIKYATKTIDGDIHKIVGDKYYVKDILYDEFHLKEDNVVGGVFSRDRGMFLFKPDGTIELKNDEYPETLKIKGINGIKNVYNVFPFANCVIQDKDGDLFYWTWSFPSELQSTLKGKEIKKFAFHMDPVKGGGSAAVLTDKLLYHIGFHIKFSRLDLPDGLSPDDIKDIQVIANSNIFLLDNNGKVYARGKNGYNQRGTTKKLKVDSWNEIEYPEKIKQIAAGNVPGLFALSENGNLYYHGYNENGYYPMTNRKSNISKPMKVMEGITSLWMIRPSVSHQGVPGRESDILLFLDEEGTLKRLTNLRVWDGDKEMGVHHPTMAPISLYKKLSSSLVMNKKMLSQLIGYECI